MSSHDGYSLVELLLALLIFSLGAMAVAAMLLGAVQATRSASESAAALMLAEDLLQRLLANAPAIDRQEQILHGDIAVPPGAAAACRGETPCSPEAWALRSMAAWLDLNAGRGLAAPRTCVSHEAGRLQVGLSWASPFAVAATRDGFCRSGADSDDRRSVTLRAVLAATP